MEGKNRARVQFRRTATATAMATAIRRDTRVSNDALSSAATDRATPAPDASAPTDAGGGTGVLVVVEFAGAVVAFARVVGDGVVVTVVGAGVGYGYGAAVWDAPLASDGYSYGLSASVALLQSQ